MLIPTQPTVSTIKLNDKKKIRSEDQGIDNWMKRYWNDNIYIFDRSMFHQHGKFGKYINLKKPYKRMVVDFLDE